ncbi:MAG TPA: hypothetical protein VFI98_04870 [Pseudolabrys sp.]|nr:hypothetical protein [Pseudolabrys sp.]
MRLGEIGASSRQLPAPAANRPGVEDAQGSEGRALVVLTPPSDRLERQATAGFAPFLAQLVATKDHHPQTRERRRAEPNEALAAYRAAALRI